MGGFWSVLLKSVYFLIVFGIIILLAYYSTRVLGKKVSKNSGKYMKIVDTLFMGNDRTLVIVRIKEDFLLMSTSARGVEIIKELDGFSEDLTGVQDDFDDYLSKYGASYKRGFWRFLRKIDSGRDVTDDK
jgi:flagellar biogenesis protein FliO